MNYSKKPIFKSALDFDTRSMSKCLEIIAVQKQLLQNIKSTLPVSIAEHALYCVVNETRVIVYTDSAAWASQIRFFHEVMLTQMHAIGWPKIGRIQVKVMQLEFVGYSLRKVQLPSVATVAAILGQIDDKSNDVLDLALGNLAKTLSKRVKPE